MKSDFDLAFEWIIKAEGNYVNNPNDPGGETKYGISKKAYPKLNIPQLTIDLARDIYYKDYWQKAGCENYAWPENIALFDTAVNMGINKALYRPVMEWRDYLFFRLAEYSKLVKNNPKLGLFFRGWVNRVVDLYRYIISNSVKTDIS